MCTMFMGVKGTPPANMSSVPKHRKSPHVLTYHILLCCFSLPFPLFFNEGLPNPPSSPAAAAWRPSHTAHECYHASPVRCSAWLGWAS